MFNNILNFSVVIVTGTGHYLGKGTSAELLSINGTRLCALPNLPERRWHHSQNGLIACGGSHNVATQESCVTFTAGSWKKTNTLGHRRWSHAGWSSPRGVLLLGGSYSGTTTELLTNKWKAIPSFKLNHNRE